MKISVVINTYNSEKHLELVLEHVKNFDEIVICDMYSTDKTIEIAERFGCKIIYHEQVGFVEPARMAAINAATYPWILVIDSDEIVPPKLKEYLYAKVKGGNCPAGLKIPFKNYFMGRFMHAAYPNYKLRFFKKEGTYWPPVIHIQPEVQGKIEKLPSFRKDLACIHLADENIEERINKLNQYTNKELLTRKKSYNYFELIVGSGYRFFKFYILKGGYKDGRAGFIFAALFAMYKFTMISKIWEKNNQYDELKKDLEKNL